MWTDRQGNTLSGGNGAAADAFDHALEAFNLYRGDPLALADDAIVLAPSMVMAPILKAYVLALSSEPAAAAEARAIVAEAKTLPSDERSRSHLHVLDLLLTNAWGAAALALDRHGMRYPHDLLALQAGHMVDFFRTDSRNLRDRIARALPMWSRDRPGYSIVLGMYAFGLEETGDYARAEEAGHEALALQPLDCWAHHAVAHVMEMQGRVDDGIRWMREREATWAGDENLFKVHNWWHLALFHLDRRQGDAALAIYDEQVRRDRSAMAMDLIDASALLWRLYLDGHDVGDRWTEVAACWDAHADGRHYPFNDWHAAMAYLGAGRTDDVARLIACFRRRGEPETETMRWASTTALPLVEGFSAFWHRDYATAVERLFPARAIAYRFGGSHAQRDIIDWTLIEAALRGGLRDVARALAGERLALKPTSRVNQAFQARAEGAAESPVSAPADALILA